MSSAGCMGSLMAAATIAPGCAGLAAPKPYHTHHSRTHGANSVLGLSNNTRIGALVTPQDAGAGFSRCGRHPRSLVIKPGDDARLHRWSSKASRFNGGQGVPTRTHQDANRSTVAGEWRKRSTAVAAALRTGVKEDMLISLEIQRDAERTFETADAASAFNQDLNLLNASRKDTGKAKGSTPPSTMGRAVHRPRGDGISETKTRVEESVSLSNVVAVEAFVERDEVLEAALAETAALLREGKSSLGTKGGRRDEFQVQSPGHNAAEMESAAWEEAVAETAEILHKMGSSLGRGPILYREGEGQVQSAVMETVQILRSGQGSFVGRRKDSNAQKRRHFWDGLQDSGFGKVLAKDGRAITNWLQSAAQKTGLADMVSKDVDFMKTMSRTVGPSLKEKVGEIVALRIIEDEAALPAAPSPWPQPYYPELRGSELVAADVRTLQEYGSHVQGILRSFQVPLQNDYDPDQVAAYFHRRPHVLVFRLAEVAAAFGVVSLQWSLQKATMKKNKIGEISDEDNYKLTLRTAESLKQALLGLGTTFIKVAQSLSARPDLIGTETAKVLAELQDRLPPFPTSEAIAIIEEELGYNVKNAFSYLSEEPVAAASFGQVYRGRTTDGQDVAVKVQRPNLLFDVARDVYILRIGMVVLKKVAKLTNNYTQLADELGQGLYGELDYRHEAENAAEFAMAHKHIPWMYVPKTLPHMTKRKLLVMEWLNGDRPFDLQCVAQGRALDGTIPTLEDQQEARRRLLNMVNKGTEAALVQLLETGVMHADPHPGNILLSRDGRLQFIDFGLITNMEKKHQGAMLAAIAHLVNGEWQSLTDDLADMDVLKPKTDRFAVRLTLESAFGDGPDALIKDGVPDPNFSFSQITKKFFKIAYKFRFRLPAYYTLVLRSLASLEGFGLAVNPEFKTFGSAYPYAVRRVLLDYTPTTRRVLRSLLLNEKREFKWDRIATLLVISQKSSADRAALETVTVPDEEDSSGGEVVLTAGAEPQQLSAGNMVGLLVSRQGIGIRRVIYEADAGALALVFASTQAANFRRSVAERLGEALLAIFKEKSFAASADRPPAANAAAPLTHSTVDKFSKDKRLRFLLKAMAGRLREQPIAAARAGWTFATVALWALALACHNFAIFLSNKYLDKAQDGEKAQRARYGAQTVAAAAAPL